MRVRVAGPWIVAMMALMIGSMAGLARAGGPSDSSTRGRPIRTDPVESARDARTLAARIDAVLAARWAKSGLRPAAIADDGEFLRRAYLDLVGKIPTAAEARDFLDDPAPGKRAALIDRLLDSPAYTAHATEVWRRMLLPEADTDDEARPFAPTFAGWLRRKVVEDAGYDRIVREILTAKLDAPQSDLDLANGVVRAVPAPSPAAYYLAKGRKPESLAAGTARVFLGIRLECAQCHNHPFASWKREQFWSLAAFFAEVPSEGNDPTRMMRRERPAPIRELTIPGTKKVVAATLLDGTKPEWRPRAGTREILAEWVTSPENPYFARALVNRVWARFLGAGLIEPVDDLDGETDPELKALLDEVSDQFRAHGDRLKFLIRTLTATRAYNLSSAGIGTGHDSSATGPMFATMPVRGLTPSQLFDSLTRATGSGQAGDRARFLELFGGGQERPSEAETTIVQALTLMNGSYIDAATDPATGRVLGAIVGAPFLDTRGRIETLFLATLTRRPTPVEMAKLVDYVGRRKSDEERSKALADIFWALLNGPEFHLNH